MGSQVNRPGPGSATTASGGECAGFVTLSCPVLLGETFRNRELRKHTSVVTNEGERTLNASGVRSNFPRGGS